MFIVRILENTRRRSPLLATIAAGLLIFLNFAKPALAYEGFPQENAWTRSTPSVVWCNDPNSTTTLEVHIVGRDDIARIWLTNDLTSEVEDETWIELFDNGTNGDLQDGDNVFTRSDAFLPYDGVKVPLYGWGCWQGFLRVELNDGRQMGHNYGTMVGLVDQKYKDTFETIELAPGLSATAYAFFIEDSNNEVIDNYPVASVYCGTKNLEAYRKLYSVMPDAFDMALVMPGMQIFRPKDLAENVPYNVLVSNAVEHIGLDIIDDTDQFGSAGKLKSVIYQSFAGIGVFDHEIAHTWGAAIGQSLGLIYKTGDYKVIQGHWDKTTDICGQLGSYYNASGNSGYFSYLSDGTWQLISNRTVLPYSPLELYIMGLIPPEEVPDIHILHSPDTNDINHITAASYETITIEDIIAAEGGERIPSVAESQKDFNLAFIVTQDIPYNDAAYAFFSLISYRLTSTKGPGLYSSLAPFYWATGDRATLETRLPLEMPDPNCLPGNNDPNCIDPILLPNL
jgi:hypothetical protein